MSTSILLLVVLAGVCLHVTVSTGDWDLNEYDQGNTLAQMVRSVLPGLKDRTLYANRLSWFPHRFKIEEINNPLLLQMALRTAHAQRLADLEAMESDMENQIRGMQKRKSDIAVQKRKHIACLVHVLSCYKKRR